MPLNADPSSLTCTGLIVRIRPLTESSLIVQWVTHECGRIATVAKGARRPASPFRGKLDLFYLDQLSLRRSRRSELHTLTEVKVLEPPGGLREDWARLQQAAYAAALIEELTETDTPIPELYGLLVTFVAGLRSETATIEHLLAFEARALQTMGLDPGGQVGALSPLAQPLLLALSTVPWPDLPRLSVPAAQAEELTRFLYARLAESLQRIPKTRRSVYRALLPSRA